MPNKLILLTIRRLQLQSILPMEHQRLVKYPLLLEQITKHYAIEEADAGELELVKEATARTKEILDNIDKQVAEAQNKRKLEDVQRNLDTSGLEKMGPDNSVNMEYRTVDLTRFRLHHDGLLTLNLGGENKRTKNVELHVLLLDDCVMFLQVRIREGARLCQSLIIICRGKMRNTCLSSTLGPTA